MQWYILTRVIYSGRFIPASNESSGCLQTFGDCREDMIDRKSREVLWREKKNVSYEYYIS